MPKPKPMAKVTILASKRRKEQIIEALYGMKILDIIDHVKSEDLDIGTPTRRSELLSSLMVKLRSICSHLKLDLTKVKMSFEPEEIEKYIEALSEKVQSVTERIKAIEEQQAKAKDLIHELGILKAVNLVPSDIRSYKSIVTFIGMAKGTIDIGEEIKTITNKAEVLTGYEKGQKIVAVFAPVDLKEQIQQILSKVGLAEIIFKMDLEQEYDMIALRKDLTDMGYKKKALKQELNRIKDDNIIKIKSAMAYLREEVEKAEAPLKFAETNDAFMIRGWIPQDELELAQTKLEKETKDRVYIIEEEVEKKDKVPIKLANSKWVKPYEFFLNMYTLPSYKEFDPAFFMFITFPIMFGFMLGDMGYGLTTLCLFLILRTVYKKGEGRKLLNALVYSSIATIFFGALFGEFFGAEVLFGHHLPRILSRNPAHSLMPLLYTGVGIGFLHLNMGLIIGFINEKCNHGLKTAFFHKGGWWVLQLAAILLALSYAHVIPISPIIGFIVFAFALYILYKGEGVQGLIEFPAIFSNMLSYSRLMALGVASVGLAMVVNQFATDFFAAKTIGGIIAGVLLLAVGHTINIALGILGPFLHSLRLHYVEFFSKFYKGGGKRYVPFGAKEE